jgi:hypothetical protein
LEEIRKNQQKFIIIDDRFSKKLEINSFQKYKQILEQENIFLKVFLGRKYSSENYLWGKL